MPAYRVAGDDLLDAARVVFAARGFDRATMQDVADAAATTKPTLYARFGSKRGLYEQAVKRDADALVGHLMQAYDSVADAGVAEMVQASMEAWFHFFARRPDAYTLLFSSGRAEPATVVADQVLDAATDRLAAMVEHVLARTGRGRSPHARLLAAMLVGVAHQGTAAARRDPASDHAAAARLATAVALAALRGLPADALALGPQH
jgi:AcrR family transcriptional regulator